MQIRLEMLMIFMKITIGDEIFLGGRLVSWISKKKKWLSQSMGEEEYVAIEKNCNPIFLMKYML